MKETPQSRDAWATGAVVLWVAPDHGHSFIETETLANRDARHRRKMRELV